MKQILQMPAIPNFTQRLYLPDGTFFTLTMQFYDQQQGWFITNLTYKTFSLNGLRICNSPNMLHQWRNQLPFGLACVSSESREPGLIQDFNSGASNLFILTAAEVQAYYEYLTSG